MATQDVTISLPEHLYLRLQRMAQATQQPLAALVLHAIEVGSPPGWEDVPVAFQEDLAALEGLPDEALWQIARSRRTTSDMERYQELLEKQSNETLLPAEHAELTQLRHEADRLMLCKAHAAALLRWRGHTLPPAEHM